jgi:hypothetical protein
MMRGGMDGNRDEGYAIPGRPRPKRTFAGGLPMNEGNAGIL